MAKSRGPRAARGEVRERLLMAAREKFWSHDYGAVTVRDIAEVAGVDPALVNYYFGGKANLFRESMSLPDDPVQVVMDMFDGDRSTLGYRVLMTSMELWEESGISASVKVLIPSLLGSETTLNDYREWVDSSIITPAARKLGGRNAKYRLENAIAHTIGLLLLRYLTQLEPLASMEREQLARLHAPVVQGLLAGQLAS